MNRRGFFASLLGREPETFFFGMQVVIATLSSDDTGNRLRRLLAEAARTNDAEKPQEKRALY